MMSIRGMSSASETRKNNLNALCVRRGWVSRKNPGAGSPAELVIRLGRTSSFWSNRLQGSRDIGAELAREIEEKLDLPKYSLDGDEESSDFVGVSKLTVEVGAGPGRLVEIVEEAGTLQFRRDFLRSAGVSQSNAAIVTVKGASMEPTIKDGAVLLINKADREPRAGNIYAFCWDGEMLVKRLFKTSEGWIARSDNPDHDDIILDGATETAIQGRAIWMGAKL